MKANIMFFIVKCGCYGICVFSLEFYKQFNAKKSDGEKVN